MVKEMPSSTVSNRDEECLRKSLMEVVKSDSSTVCRLCLSKEPKLTRVFEDDSGIDDALLKKIFDCTSVKVKLKDIFPSGICAVCDLKLNDFFKFREKCIENNTILHNLLGEDEPENVGLSGDGKTRSGNDAEEGDKQDEQDDDEHKEREQQQAATSTTSISEVQQNGSTVAIALNQLSELGLRAMHELAGEKDDDSDVTGTIRVAKNLLAVPDGEVANVVSSSWVAAQQEPPEPSAHGGNRKRSYVLATMGMSDGTNHRAGREGKYECKECRRTFRNAYTLRRHNNLHTRTNLFPCEYCGKKFNDRSNWKIHQRSHTGDNLYTCLVCLKTFISPSTLKYHLRSHRRLKTFDCRVCQDSFGSYDLLEEHAQNQHQQGCLGLEDFSADGDHLIDAARFVKIELEDGELPSSVGNISTTTTTGTSRSMHTTMAHQTVGDDDEELEDEDVRLPVDGQQFVEGSGLEGENNHPVVGSSSGPGCQVSHAQVAQLVEQRRQQLLEHVLQEQMRAEAAEERMAAEAAAAAAVAGAEVVIKQEAPSEADVAVKEEPQDDSFEMDPSELLQQAMEEAEADDQDKELTSSSSSSPSTVILFRCDYCMKIFHYLDELNAHMLLHNGVKGAGGNSALVLGTLDSSAALRPGQVKTILRPTVMGGSESATLQQLMLQQLTSPSIPPPAGSDGDGTVTRQKGSTGAAAVHQYPMRQLQVVYRRSDGAPGTGPELAKRRRNGFEPDPADVVNALPPEHPCSKCSKRFRTEELRRVHEATHANDEQVNKVRSCRFCNKVFKCELNLLAHMRKHDAHHVLGTVRSANDPEGGGSGSGGGGGGDSAGSGNDESCSSTSHLPHGGLTNAHHDLAACNDGGGGTEQGDGGAGSTSDGEAGSSSSGGGGPKCAQRRCEICAIGFTDAALLEKHVLNHFERNEAVAFVPSTDRPFKCTECHKRFKRKDYLLIHIRTHTGERRYKCDLCSSAFVHPSNLITHRKLHSNERPHKCTLCNATFKLYAGLKIHKRRCEQKLPRLGGTSDPEDQCYRWPK